MTDDAHADGSARESTGSHERRRERAASRLDEVDASGLVAFPSRNLQYLTGFAEEPGERHFFLVVPAASAADPEPALLAPALYETQVREATSIGEIRTWSDGDDPVAATRELLADRGLDAGRLLV